MVFILKLILGLALCAQAFIGLTFFISSIQENEKRASVLSCVQLIGMLILVILFFGLNWIGFFDSGIGIFIIICAIVLGAITVFLFFSKMGTNPKALQGTKGLIVGEVKQWDERDIEFSKMREMMVRMASSKDASQEGPPAGDKKAAGLTPGKPIITPDGIERIPDEVMNSFEFDHFAAGDGLGGIDAPHGQANVAMTGAAANFSGYLAKQKIFEPPISDKKMDIDPELASTRVKGFTLHLGAELVGIAEVDPRWLYSHYGVSGLELKEWGKEVQNSHKYAIVFAEEMDFDLVGAGPHTPIIIESIRNYAKGAFIGTQVASFIANMGYSAKAHHSAHYDGLIVPLAVEAGLGELSRMGYLMSKEFGPRMRLSAVTTDLPLVPDKPVDIGIMNFCRICKKCAECCPSKSITHYDDPTDNNGSLRWKLDGATCVQYWQKIGTDCGVCMRVCPWAHARTFPHKIIVEAVSRNKNARMLFNLMDDIFYGKKPKAKNPPEWATISR